MFIQTVYKIIFMNFMVELLKIDEIYIGLTLFTNVFLQKSLIYIDFDRGSGKQKSILTGGPGENANHVLTGGPSRTNPPPQPDPDPPCPRMALATLIVHSTLLEPFRDRRPINSKRACPVRQAFRFERIYFSILNE